MKIHKRNNCQGLEKYGNKIFNIKKWKAKVKFNAEVTIFIHFYKTNTISKMYIILPSILL